MAGIKINSAGVLPLRSRPAWKRFGAGRSAWIMASLATWSGTALCQPRQLELDWQAPPECPTQAQIEAEVVRLISPYVTDAARMVARARVDSDAKGRYRMFLHTRQGGNDGERQFVGATCQAVADAAVVTLAISLDPNAEIPTRLAGAASDRAPKDLLASVGEAPKPTLPNPLPRSTTVALVAAAVQPETTRIVARAFGAGHAGVLPNPALSLGIGLGLQYREFAGYATVALAPLTQTATSQAAPGLGGKFGMQSIEAEACWAMGSERLSLLPCLGASFFRVHTEGQNVVPVREGSLTWVAPLLGLGLRARVNGPLSAFVTGKAALALKQPLAYITPQDPVFQPDQVAYQLQGGVELRIW